MLNGYPIDWLLERENPSLRHLTLVDLLERSIDHPEVIEAKRGLMKTGVVPEILAKQEREHLSVHSAITN